MPRADATCVLDTHAWLFAASGGGERHMRLLCGRASRARNRDRTDSFGHGALRYHRPMRLARPVLFAIVLLGLMAPAASAADAPEILFSANPKNVQIVKSGKTLRLVMPANARTTWFTDRPERKAGSTNLRRLAATWTAMGFRADPPNAALILTHKGQIRTHVVTLTRPRIRNGRVSYRIRAVPNQDEAGHRHTDPLRRGRYARAQLFIDDTALPPCGALLQNGTTCLLPGNAEALYAAFVLSTSTVEACVEGAITDLRPALGYRIGFDVTGQWYPPACADDAVPPVVGSDIAGTIFLQNIAPSSYVMQVRVVNENN
jgi:hypothetical protein